MPAYYNENDPKAAAWLRELIRHNLIAPGHVDERSIADVRGDELGGYTQHHFFAGIGGWSLALRLAGWADDRAVFTGSCPCQPFSAAGRRRGTADERHLWPEFRRIIAECGPATVFGEQVASADGRLWLAGVRADLEALGYGVGAADLCAAGAGAPHIRQRLYWMADTDQGKRGRFSVGGERVADGAAAGWLEGDGEPQPNSDAGRLALTTEPGWREQPGRDGRENGRAAPEPRRLRDADRSDINEAMLRLRRTYGVQVDGLLSTPWQDADWLECTDGKARRVEPGTFPLAHGVPARVGRLRGYGNAIVPQVAAEFIACYRDAFG